MSQVPLPSPQGEYEKDFKGEDHHVEDLPKIGAAGLSEAKVKAVKDVSGKIALADGIISDRRW